MNYALKNQSKVSDEYIGSVRRVGPSGIAGPAPVQYPTAQIESSRALQMDRNREVNQAFNDIATDYKGQTTTYNADRTGQQYDLIGTQYDAYI